MNIIFIQKRFIVFALIEFQQTIDEESFNVKKEGKMNVDAGKWKEVFFLRSLLIRRIL